MEERFPGHWTHNGYSVRPEEVVRYYQAAELGLARIIKKRRSPIGRLASMTVNGSNKMMLESSLAKEHLAKAKNFAIFASNYFLLDWQRQVAEQASEEGIEINL